MDAQKAILNYTSKMMAAVQGVKALLLDKETTAIVSVVTTQTYLLQNEVFLTTKIQSDDPNQSQQPSSLKHLKAIVFIRPSADSIQSLCEELRNPRYGEYHLFFSNIIKKSQIERIAECDEFESVKTLQEFYGDFLSLSSDLISFGMGDMRLYGDSASVWDAQSLSRAVEGVLALLLSMKKKPTIRFEKNSLLCKRLGNEVLSQINQEGQLFDFRRGDSQPVLLILDRKNDPITPLIGPWTYQAMVHELLGIQNGRVSLSHVPDVREELKQVVLSEQNDPFYKKNMFSNLGDLSESIKDYVMEYQQKSHSTTKIDSIADMKRFVEDYPQFRQMSGNVSMHVAIVGELSRMVTRDDLLEVGELEQSLATVDNHNVDYNNVLQLINKESVPHDCKVRLVTLYAIRYESSTLNQLRALIDQLKRNGVSDQKCSAIQQMLKFAGQSERLQDVLSSDFISKSKNAIYKGLKGVENVYEQHRPQLGTLLDQLGKSGKVSQLKDALYPCVDNALVQSSAIKEVFIFIVGGVTYSEARLVHQFNASNAAGVKVVLGGTSVINSKQFINQVSEASSRWSGSGAYR